MPQMKKDAEKSTDSRKRRRRGILNILSPDEAQILKDDPDFQEYCRSLERASETAACDETSVEVVKAMFGPNLLEFQNRVWLFSDLDTVYICDRCLQKCSDAVSLERHGERCRAHLLGRLVYAEKEDAVTVFEVDGEQNPALCQLLCILGKAFIRRKTLYLDVDGYLFYVLGSEGKVVGFFSKEKSNTIHNLSCLLVLPPHRARGYGSLLVDLSYCLGGGSPEKPLSRDGQVVYKKYWENRILEVLQSLNGQSISIRELGERSGLSIDDVVHALELLGVDPEEPTYNLGKKTPARFRRCRPECLVN